MEKDEFLSKLARVQLICETVEDLMGHVNSDHFDYTSAGVLKKHTSRGGTVAAGEDMEAENAFWWVHDRYDSVSAGVMAANLLAQSAAELTEQLYGAAREGLV